MDDIKITAEPALNGGSCKFVIDRPVYADGAAYFNSKEKAAGSALAKRLFGIAGVKNVLIAGNAVTVTAGPFDDWRPAAKSVAVAIRDQIRSGLPAVDPNVKEEAAGREADIGFHPPQELQDFFGLSRFVTLIVLPDNVLGALVHGHRLDGRRAHVDADQESHSSPTHAAVHHIGDVPYEVGGHPDNARPPRYSIKRSLQIRPSGHERANVIETLSRRPEGGVELGPRACLRVAKCHLRAAVGVDLAFARGFDG